MTSVPAFGRGKVGRWKILPEGAKGGKGGHPGHGHLSYEPKHSNQ